jgi:hypothetical protein
MKNIAAIFIALLFFPFAVQGRPFKAQSNTTAQRPITLPPAQSQTVTPDVSFQLGQQSGKIDAMTKRLDNIEIDVKEISKDVGKLNVYAALAGIVLLAIIIPLIYEGLKRQFFKDQPKSATP